MRTKVSDNSHYVTKGNNVTLVEKRMMMYK